MAHPLWTDFVRTLKREPIAERQSNSFTFGGVPYTYMPSYSYGYERQETPDQSFEGYATQMYASNAVVFACMNVRMLLFAEARFQFRQMKGGRPGDLFGTPELQILEHPWQNATTADLLSRAMQDADIAGNFYAVREGSELRRLRPDWVTIVMGSKRLADSPALASDAEVIGYIYQPGGNLNRYEPVTFLPDQVCHFAPIPDPLAHFRGMSWLTPIIREVMGDNAATSHKLTFFEKGATPNMVVMLDPQFTPEQVSTFASSFREQHAQVADAYRTMFFGGGAKIDVVGANLQEVDFKVTQGGGETRIAAAAGVPPVIAGLSEGLAAATYSNYQQSIRRFTDLTMRPLWRNMAGSLATILTVPSQAELWYDDRDIPALAEDQKDLATVRMSQATQLKTLIDAGFDPDSAISAVTSSDFTRLTHSGLVSVQLQPPGTQVDAAPNGNAPLPIGADA